MESSDKNKCNRVGFFIELFCFCVSQNEVTSVQVIKILILMLQTFSLCLFCVVREIKKLVKMIIGGN